MAKSRRFRTFNVDGKELVFFPGAFNQAVINELSDRKANGQKATKEEIYDELADETARSSDAVKQWKKGYNGPDDIETVKKMAEHLNIDYRELLKEPEIESVSSDIRMPDVIAISDEKSLVLQVYQMAVDYIYWFVGNSDECMAGAFVDILDLQMRYEDNMFRILDKSSLFVKDDVYKKLHVIISDCIFTSRASYGPEYRDFPQRWRDINPELALVHEIRQYDLDEVIELSRDGDNEFYDYLSALEMDEKGESIYYWMSYPCYKNGKPNMKKGRKIKYDICPLDIYQIASRKAAETLKMIMRSDFPEYFQ